MPIQLKNFKLSFFTLSVLISVYASNTNAATAEPQIDSKASKVPYDASIFGSDPVYDYEH